MIPRISTVEGDLAEVLVARMFTLRIGSKREGRTRLRAVTALDGCRREGLVNVLDASRSRIRAAYLPSQ